MNNPKQHRVWRPRMDSGGVLNPFTRSTETEADRRTLEDSEEWTQESEAGEAESEPIKSGPS
jgi:hypothetical protein